MPYDGPFALDLGTKFFLERDPFLFIDGEATGSDGEDTLIVFDPSRGRAIAAAADAKEADVDRAVRSGHAAFANGQWRNLRPADRERIVMRFANLLVERG